MQRKGHCDNKSINWGSVIGAGVGSAVGGAMGAQMTNMALAVGGSEALSNLLSAIGMAPTALGGAIGGALYNNPR
jgi:hypothetical protein